MPRTELAKSVESHVKGFVGLFSAITDEGSQDVMSTSDETLARIEVYFNEAFPKDLQAMKDAGLSELDIHVYTVEYRKLKHWINDQLKNELARKEADNLAIATQILMFLGNHTNALITSAEKQSNEKLSRRLKEALIAFI